MPPAPQKKRKAFCHNNISAFEALPGECMERIISFAEWNNLVTLRSLSTRFREEPRLFRVVHLAKESLYAQTFSNYIECACRCNQAILVSVLDNESFDRSLCRAIIERMVRKNNGGAVALLLSRMKSIEKENLLEFALRLEVYEHRQLPDAIKALRNDPEITALVTLCEVCGQEMAIFECQRGSDCLRSWNEHSIGMTPSKRCTACLADGRHCSTCKQFLCDECVDIEAEDALMWGGNINISCTVCDKPMHDLRFL